MTRKSDRDTLLDQIPSDGTTIGNTTLINKLGWDEDKYWNVRNELVTDGIVSVGRGKGGVRPLNNVTISGVKHLIQIDSSKKAQSNASDNQIGIRRHGNIGGYS